MRQYISNVSLSVADWLSQASDSTTTTTNITSPTSPVTSTSTILDKVSLITSPTTAGTLIPLSDITNANNTSTSATSVLKTDFRLSDSPTESSTNTLPVKSSTMPTSTVNQDTWAGTLPPKSYLTAATASTVNRDRHDATNGTVTPFYEQRTTQEGTKTVSMQSSTRPPGYLILCADTRRVAEEAEQSAITHCG